MIVMLSLPFALMGGVTFMALLGYNWSVGTAIGFIALAGVAAETGVVMLIYLDHAWDARRLQGRQSLADLHQAVMEGTVDRVRPKLMTVIAIIAGLLPILWAHGTGGDVMKRIAAPMVGGMLGAVIDELIVLPAMYSLWRERQLRRSGALGRESAGAAPPLPPAPLATQP
jgi:Cu(I)/Ag(I) efflux system membrane protein CusA/SilA